jgi:hypothetical protein
VGKRYIIIEEEPKGTSDKWLCIVMIIAAIFA